MSDPRTDPSSEPEIVSGQNAAQGRRGTRVFRILLISLGLVVAAFAVIYAFHAPGLSTNHGAGGQSGIINHAEANAFHEPEPAAKPAPANGTANSSQ